MAILFIGPPGCGKTTQAYRLSQQQKELRHINIDHTLYKSSNKNTPAGQRIRETLNRGRLPSDSIVGKLIQNKINGCPYKQTPIIDGAPKTRPQAYALNDIIDEKGYNLNRIYYLHIDKPAIFVRLNERLFCPNCGITFHKRIHKPQSDNLCDYCNTTLVQWPGDTQRSINKRIENYERKTKQVIEYYRSWDEFKEISGEKNVSELQTRIRRDWRKNGG